MIGVEQNPTSEVCLVDGPVTLLGPIKAQISLRAYHYIHGPSNGGPNWSMIWPIKSSVSRRETVHRSNWLGESNDSNRLRRAPERWLFEV